MSLEKGKISNVELFFTFFVFISVINIYLPDVESAASHDSWIAGLIGVVEGVVIVYLYTTLALKFPGKTIIEINDILYGRYIGKLISIMYILYFLSTIVNVTQFLGTFTTDVILDITPIIVFLIMLFIVSAYGLKKGLEVICRGTFIIAIFVFIEIVISTILLIKDMDFEYLLPIMETDIKDILKGGHILAGYYGESLGFLMVIPFVNNSSKHTRSAIVLSGIIGGIIFITALIRNAAVLGNLVDVYTYSTYSTIRLINLGDVFTRLDILLYIELISGIFIQISILYYALTLSTAQILKLKTYKPLIIPIGIVVISLGMIDTKIPTILMNDFYTNIYPIYTVIFQIILPVLSLIILAFRKNIVLNKEQI